MIPAIISLVIAVLIAINVRTSLRFGAFTISMLILLPCVAYIVTGTQMVFSDMGTMQVVSDFFSIAKQCYIEPFRLVSSPGSPDLNLIFSIVGFVIIVSTLISIGQFLSWIVNRSKDNVNESLRHE